MADLTKLSFMTGLLFLFIAAGFAGGTSSAFEIGLMQAAADFRAGHPQLTAVVGGITDLGGAYATLGLTAAASLWLLLGKMPARALLLAVTVLLERVLVEALKDWVGRPRPHLGVDMLPTSLAFPSGHSANSMTAFLAAALIVAPPAHRGPWVAGALLLTFVVGLSRVYLGVHWPSDVIGGWTLGLLSVSIALTIGMKSGALPIEPQHQIVGRHVPALDEDETA
jgi:undecaprenyl-diphosphatase